MKINLNKKQYESLAKIVYLGNWMANAQRTGAQGDPKMKEYDEIADYIYSLAPEYGLPDSYESELEFADDNDDITEVSRLHEEYDEENLWEKLSDWLGERDFFRKYTLDEIKKMSSNERFMKSMDCNIVWEEEFENYGIERLEIKGDIESKYLEELN
ncbi:MAG: hypothetical protein WC898_02945 [Candidatus Paceibacterota bacterium]|jgi:hypothetical protein